MSECKDRHLTGRCACGAVRFEVNGLLRPVIACHCQTCRKTSGHYWAATEAYRANLRLLDERWLKWFQSSELAQRGFCSECGSSLFFRRHDSDRISIAAGALEAPTTLDLVEHICSREAGDYYMIENDLSQHAGNTISEHRRLPPRGG